VLALVRGAREGDTGAFVRAQGADAGHADEPVVPESLEGCAGFRDGEAGAARDAVGGVAAAVQNLQDFPDAPWAFEVRLEGAPFRVVRRFSRGTGFEHAGRLG